MFGSKHIKLVLLLLLFIGGAARLNAQLTYGNVGLLHAPSAEMQPDKTVMIGANFLNRHLTPPTWSYHTFNWFLNFTIFPWMEVGFTQTAFKLQLHNDTQPRYTNQDRFFSLRVRLIEEGKFWQYMPAVVVGTSDPYTESSTGLPTTGNGHHCRFYLALTKHIKIGSEKLGLHLSYLYNQREDYHLNGPAFGVSCNPSFDERLRFVAEYDSKDVALGASYLFFKFLHLQAELQRFRYFSGGVTFMLHLK